MRIIALVVSVVLHCFGSCRASSTKTFHVRLGSTIVIDCEGKGKEMKMSFRKDSKASKHVLYETDKHGVTFYHTLKHDPKRTVAKNMSLVITDFSKDNEGLYICEVGQCQDSSPCTVTISECILEEKPLLNKCLYAVRGSVYEQECLPAMGKTGEWTFHLTGNVKQYSQSFPPGLTNIQGHVAGNSTCWIAAQDGRRERAFSLVLCVVSGTSDVGKSVQNCTPMCGKRSDMERSGPVVVTDRNNTTAFQPKGPDGLINYNATVEGKVHLQANSSVETGSPTAGELAWISLSVVGLCCLVAVLVAYRQRKRVTVSNTDCPRDDCHINSSAEAELLYSSVCLRRSDGSVLRSANECVYSDIKVENEKITQ